MGIFKKILLVVLDGFGVASSAPGNAVTRARLPTFNHLVNAYPALTLQAAGPNVGLPWGEPGNSEVGHMCMGAGRVVLQDLPRIDQAIHEGEFYHNEAFIKAIAHAKEHNSALHLIGLIGSGGVHASQLHLYSLLILCLQQNFKNVYIHVITDGRDTEPDAGYPAVRELEKKMLELGIGSIATVSGRFFAMDRAQHWDLTELAYRAMVGGQGEVAPAALAAIEQYYSQNIFDETIPPTIIASPPGQPATIKDSDAVIIFNFRPDRALQLTQALLDPTTISFTRTYQKLQNLKIVTMTEYAKNLAVTVAFPKLLVGNTLSEVVAQAGMRQYHIAEVEKYPHVTYFFSNGRPQPFVGEVWDQVSSPISYHDRYQNVPQMSSPELTQKLLAAFDQPYQFYLVNYANPDMVGHTGNLEAAIKALETIDSCLQTLLQAIRQRDDFLVVITADHGNIEEVHEVHTGRIHKSHTTNPVPFILAGRRLLLPHPRTAGYLHLATLTPEGLLSDIAPTLLALLGLKQSQEMTGVSLVEVFERQLKS